MLETLSNDLLYLGLTALGGGGLALAIKTLADRYANPVIRAAANKIDLYLAEPQNRWKAGVVQKIFSALDPLLPELIPAYGSEEVENVVKLLAALYARKGVSDDVVEEIVDLYRLRFDPLRQNLNASPLSQALAQAIESHKAAHPGTETLLTGLDELSPFMPQV